MNRIMVLFMLLLPGFTAAIAQDTDTLKTQHLEEVTVKARRMGTARMSRAVNGLTIGREELFRAACCNLGESFTTNPSVDVSYSDAATGARQIRLLGLSGIYVQMLTENLPDFQGVAAPYSLEYVPGPWMQSIQVSKGASSVRNGYQSITGQIDIEYLKPDDDEGVTANLYGNSKSRMEVNADANFHLDSHLSTEILAHFQDDYGHHDENHDGFLDQPDVRQWNLQNRWKWKGDRYLFHGGLGLIRENREGGQTHHTAPESHHLFQTGVVTDRYVGYMKHAFILDPDHGSNIALMGNVAMHLMDATYGHRTYHVNGKNAYAQLMYECNITEKHNLSLGVSLQHDFLAQKLRNAGFEVSDEQETTTGAYAQYTFTLDKRLALMLGGRIDHSSRYGTFGTPRLHLKWQPAEWMNLRISAGQGRRTAHALAENSQLLASGRTMTIDDLQQEKAYNYGASGAFDIPLMRKTLRVNAEFYHTRFSRQAVVDYDSDAAQIHIANLQGRSFSNTFQVDASYPLFEGLELSAAWRWNEVKTTYGGHLREKPLTSRYKGLVSASYKTPLGLWQVDINLQLNGGGRMPVPYQLADGTMSWPERFRAYEQLSAQLTRWFRHFSIYVGGENLTAFRQEQVIIDAEHPWGTSFDPTLVWGPVHGRLFYAGIRVNIGKKL